MPYFHLVFAIPAILGAIAYQNKTRVYGLLLKAAAEALVTFASDRQHLGADIGITAVLHTWGAALQHHPHAHCIVPGGGISPDGKRWIACKATLFRPDVLSRLFRRLFLDGLTAAYQAGELQFFNDLVTLKDPSKFTATLTAQWLVYSKKPFAGPRQVLGYLARYTHRVAITNNRLIAIDETHVSFRWRIYRSSGRYRNKVMRITIAEFIRRFLLHVLPNGFHRIRYYGLLANGHRASKLAHCRSLLDLPAAATPLREDHDGASRERVREPPPCPCRGGRMQIIETFNGLLSRPYHVRRLDGL